MAMDSGGGGGGGGGGGVGPPIIRFTFSLFPPGRVLITRNSYRSFIRDYSKFATKKGAFRMDEYEATAGLEEMTVKEDDAK